MKVAHIRLMQEPYKTFIFYKENNRFTPWHNHPEYELILIIKGRGKRMVGNNIDRFEENDLTFIGSNTPHEYQCDPEYFEHTDGFLGEGIVIQFVYNFLGDKFFELPENAALKKFLIKSSRGYDFYGASKKKIINTMLKMSDMNDSDRLYSLLSIFKIFATTEEINVLSNIAYKETISSNGNDPLQKALQYISNNFQDHIQVQDLLKITNMSNTSFFTAFKQNYKMPFQDYLLNMRVGYACKLLIHSTQNVSEIAYDSGFRNISNFNRQFKKIKGISPSRFKKEVSHL